MIEISNGFIRDFEGCWHSLLNIHYFFAQNGDIRFTGEIEGFSSLLLRCDSEAQAQSQLDKLMRSKWN